MFDKIQLSKPVTLKELRMISGLNQEGFAKYLEIPLTTYRRYEKNTGKIELHKVLDICSKCKIEISMLKV